MACAHRVLLVIPTAIEGINLKSHVCLVHLLFGQCELPTADKTERKSQIAGVTSKHMIDFYINTVRKEMRAERQWCVRWLTFSVQE